MKLPFSRKGLSLYAPLWKLDGASFMERSAYGHRLTASGPIFYPKRGRYFDDTDDNIALPTAAFQAFASTDDFTILVWFYVDGTIAANRCVFGLVGNDAGNKPKISFEHESSDNKLYVMVRQTANATRNIVGSIAVMTTGWHCGILAHDANDNNKVYLDLDGVNQGSDGTNALTFAGADFFEGHIGAMGVTGLAANVFWKDKIGDVIAWKRLLTSPERQNVYLSSKWRYA